ncbi:uncharacterized protein GBIM_16634, partial [Gryllus bimaculatus]
WLTLRRGWARAPPGRAHRPRFSRREAVADPPGRASPAPSLASACSVEDLQARGEEAESRRRQAQAARLREQEAERQERARLEEILALCAEYERQAQSERALQQQQTPSPRPPNTPTLQQNRIKTNGSLPRDKRLASPGGGVSASEDELAEIFTFDLAASAGYSSSPVASPPAGPGAAAAQKQSGRSPYENVAVGGAGPQLQQPQSPRTRIRTIVPQAPPAHSPDAPPDALGAPLAAGRLNGELRARERGREHRARRADDSSPNSEDSPMTRDEGDLLRKERTKLLGTLSAIKRKITEVEQQEEELLRGLEMERALLEGEWAAQRDRSLQDEARLSALRARVGRLDGELERGRAREVARQGDCRQRLEAAAAEMHRLEQEVIRSAGCPERQREIADRLQHQHDLLEAEKKAFEDLEFRHLEEEAGWLAAREEAQREAAEVGARAAERRARLAALEQQRRAAANQLRVVEARLEELTQHGVISSQESSADASSDVDEPAATSPSTSLQSPQSPQSQDDLARISRVTLGAPLDVNTGSLGRKALASLKEIERNRQLHLAQQGSQVIEEERKRVQELKRRVQDEVRAQWEERRQQQQQQRGAHCASLNSVGSDEASLTSSDVPTESASSDDALEKRIPSGPASGVNGTSTASTVNGSSKNNGKGEGEQTNPQLQASVREKELELERDYEETRPLSDAAAAYDRQLGVRMRDKASRLQRPLTRYLPIRGAGLDLRAHVESAGHQVELCPHVALDAASCRGALHKLGSRFHHWNKRWFVFDRSKRTLMYFADRAEKKPRGGAFFQSIEEVYVDHLNSVKSPNPQLTFVVKTVERTYHLMAPSAEAMRIWVDVIFTGAEGYQEFDAGT